MSLNIGQISSLTMELSAPWASAKYSFTRFPLQLFIQIFLILADNQNWHNILSVWIYSWSVSNSELPAFEHSRLWCLQTICWLPGERLLPIGLLVLRVLNLDIFPIRNALGCLVCVICNSNSLYSSIFKLCIIIVHTLKMCTFYFVNISWTFFHFLGVLNLDIFSVKF